ncbi:MAG: CGNR zinc finger domain-containing protein [Actinomycetota bacterium]
MSEATAGPGRLDLVIRFLNTNDVEGGRDELRDARALKRWLVEHDLVAASDLVTPADVARTVEFREALRDLARANHGGRIDGQALRVLNQATETAPLRVSFDEKRANLVPQGLGTAHAIALLAGNVFAATADGTWGRLKVCLRDSCRWAFYDRSKNRSRSWCSMAVCGNRTKAELYRERHAPG